VFEAQVTAIVARAWCIYGRNGCAEAGKPLPMQRLSQGAAQRVPLFLLRLVLPDEHGKR